MNETFKKQAQELTASELERHASVGRICRCNDCFCCVALAEQEARATRFSPGQCAVFTDDCGTTRSVKIVSANRGGVRVYWRTSADTYKERRLTLQQAANRLVLFPKGEKFMVT